MKIFLNGLGLVIPTAIIFYILLWLLQKTEAFFKKYLLMTLPSEYYIAGMGLVAGVIFVFIIGLLLKLWIVQRIRDKIEQIMNKMPLIGSIYGAIKDFLNFFSTIKERKDSITVLVDLPALDAKLVGMVTVTDFKKFDVLDDEEMVVVYLQLSYQIGGYSILIPKKNLTPIDMSIEEAFRFTMTAGISSSEKHKADTKESN